MRYTCEPHLSGEASSVRVPFTWFYTFELWRNFTASHPLMFFFLNIVSAAAANKTVRDANKCFGSDTHFFPVSTATDSNICNNQISTSRLNGFSSIAFLIETEKETWVNVCVRMSSATATSGSNLTLTNWIQPSLCISLHYSWSVSFFLFRFGTVWNAEFYRTNAFATFPAFISSYYLSIRHGRGINCINSVRRNLCYDISVILQSAPLSQWLTVQCLHRSIIKTL